MSADLPDAVLAGGRGNRAQVHRLMSERCQRMGPRCAMVDGRSPELAARLRALHDTGAPHCRCLGRPVGACGTMTHVAYEHVCGTRADAPSQA